MKILYIHGLESTPHPQKMDILAKRGHEVTAPHVKFTEYKDTNEPYQLLRDLAVKENVEFIVGSSFGGFMGYWLGHDLGLPQLLFNPALCYNSLLMPHPLVPVRNELPSWVVLGAKDEVLPANLNVEFFDNKPSARVMTCQWLPHKIDLQTFEEMLRWAGL